MRGRMEQTSASREREGCEQWKGCEASEYSRERPAVLYGKFLVVTLAPEPG